jgi:hypothetical protein
MIVAIDVSEPARRVLGHNGPAPYPKIAASVGAVGGLSNPEDGQLVGSLVGMVLTLPRKRLTEGAWLVVSPKGRRFVVVEDEGQVVVLHELEYRLAHGDVEVEVFAKRPEVLQ